ncbi:MAG TPA: amidase [Pyrinomonadaceae bacterium]|nr:amidase [Pyrinomonadaceae bacterium]
MKRRDFLSLSAAAASAALLVSNPEKISAQTGMKSFELEEVTVMELQDAMKSGKMSSREITQKYLDRIAAIDKQLNSVIETNPDALAIADAMDKERKTGKIRSQMHGIPILIKDNIDTADKMKTTAGSLALLDAPTPKQDAFLVQKLREAGAVIIGKTNLSEWANFRSTRSSSGWSGRGGQTHNPYILDRNPCGSSAGTGAAIAANLAATGIGTETDGSIICPSATCGIVGLKPTLGLVSRAGVIPIAHSQDTAGPMTRSVADAAILLGVLIGNDPNDAITAQAVKGKKDYTSFLQKDGLKGARIGVARAIFGRNSKIDAVVEPHLKVLQAGGATLVDIEFASSGKFGDAEYEVLLYEFKEDLNKYLAGRGGQHKTLADLIKFNEANRDKEMPYFGQEIFLQAQEKGDLNERAYQLALLQSKIYTQEQGIDAVMSLNKLDAIVAPSGGVAWMTDLVNGDCGVFEGITSFAAVAGYPSITVPAGYVQELPVGITFVGRAFTEDILIKLAYAFEQATKARKPPKFLPTYS